ncbi:Arc family DNA-binding protein [Xenorhabdus stockiae]|uniref:Arc family DNA-binding protein n=1 Tax=Xenorhabdus stockiae TaxID=351614 RepID=UPI003CE9A958
MSRIAPYPLRMPPELREALEQKAEKSKRSLQQEVIYHIDMSLQIEKLFAATSSDDIYTRIAKALKSESESKKKDEDIEKLKMQISLLHGITKDTDTDRFMKISTQVKIAQEALDNITKHIPPRYEEPIKTKK